MGQIRRWLARKREANRRRWEAMRARRAWIRATFFPGRKWNQFLLRAYVAYVLVCFLFSVGFHLLALVHSEVARIAGAFLVSVVIARLLKWQMPELRTIMHTPMPLPPKPYREPPPPPLNDPGTSGSPSPVLPTAPAPTREASRQLPVPILTDVSA